MGDFVTTGTTKTAVRTLATPIADANSYTTLIQGILTANPWECTPYESAGVAHSGIEKSKESYSGKIVYLNNEAKSIGNVSIKAPTLAGFTTCVSNVLADSALETAIGGSCSHDSSEDKYSVTFRCHNSDGDLYYVTISRDKIRVSSFESEDVKATLETWADANENLA